MLNISYCFYNVVNYVLRQGIILFAGIFNLMSVPYCLVKTSPLMMYFK